MGQDFKLKNGIIINSQNLLKFNIPSSNNYVAFKGPSSGSSNITWTLPNTIGENNQVLSTNAAGYLFWTTQPVNQGPQGPQGSQGYVGDQGAQGDIGPQGTQGAQGNQGTQGAGFQGSQGTQGTQGNQGSGAQGAQGFQGAGSQGAQGFQGANGGGGSNTKSIIYSMIFGS